ncbi:MAG: elongation factor G [Clostridia bacterium]
MSKVTTDLIRNIALIGHSGEGKTSLAEAMLFNAKSIERLGKTDDGNSTMDFDPEEINRKISISLAAAYGFWKENKLNILDVPGFFDFEGEVVSALSVVDSAIIVTSASGSLSVGTEKAIEMCTEKKVPAFVFINQINKENSNFEGTLEAITAAYGGKVIPVEIPIIEANKMIGCVDVIKGKAFRFDTITDEMPIPESMVARFEDYRARIIEIAAETDDALIEKYFEGATLTEEELRIGIRKAILNDTLIPLMAGNATTNLGVMNLLDKICEMLPSPADSPVKKAFVDANEIDVSCDENLPFSAQVFKAVADPYVGKLLYFKVMSGKLNAGDQMFNTNSEKTEKASSLYILKGKKQETVDSLVAGDIGALAKLVATNIGDTLCDSNKKIKFPSIAFPEPVISLAVTSAKSGEEDKVINGLTRMLEEDSTFKLTKNAATGDVLVSGLGESQLQIICARLKNKFGVEAKLSDPKIEYRETIKKAVEAEGKHKKQSGGAGQFGVVVIRFEPGAADGEFEFVDGVVGGAVPKQFIPAVEKGLREAIKGGVLAGYPMVNLKASLIDGKYHPVDSKEIAFVTAAKLAYNEACLKANPCFLEPIMDVKITIPDTFLGDIMGDITKRRGRIIGTDTMGKKQVLTAEAPMAEMFRYATDLNSMTQGRGRFKMSFNRYEEVPSSVAPKIIEDAKKRAEAVK